MKMHTSKKTPYICASTRDERSRIWSAERVHRNGLALSITKEPSLSCFAMQRKPKPRLHKIHGDNLVPE